MELRVLGRRCVVEGRELGETHVRAPHPGCGYLRQRLRLCGCAVCGEDCVPTVSLSLDGQAYHLPEQRPVDEDSDVSDARKIKAVFATQFEAGLRVCQRIIPVRLLPSWEACTPFEEVREGAMDAVSDILDGLAVDYLELMVSFPSIE